MKLIYAVFAVLILSFSALADTGHEGATRREEGSYGQTFVVTGSSNSGTAFANSTVKRPAGLYLNNTGSTVWIGTTSATMNGTTNHENIRIGIPLVSSATINMASFTGAWYFTCNTGVTTCEMRSLEGLVR